MADQTQTPTPDGSKEQLLDHVCGLWDDESPRMGGETRVVPVGIQVSLASNLHDVVEAGHGPDAASKVSDLHDLLDSGWEVYTGPNGDGSYLYVLEPGHGMDVDGLAECEN